jgi:hypothetical protein
MTPDKATRYVVKKESGSLYARVIDTKTDRIIRSFNILNGIGKNNGWKRALYLTERLNQSDK